MLQLRSIRQWRYAEQSSISKRAMEPKFHIFRKFKVVMIHCDDSDTKLMSVF